MRKKWPGFTISLLGVRYWELRFRDARSIIQTAMATRKTGAVSLPVITLRLA
jgi:hypothetical protein